MNIMSCRKSPKFFGFWPDSREIRRAEQFPGEIERMSENMKLKILKAGLWVLSLFGYAVLIVNLALYFYIGSLDYTLDIASLVTVAILYSTLNNSILALVAVGFLGGSLATYLLLKVAPKFQ